MSAQTLGILGLTLAYAALAVLLLSLNLRSRWHWLVKSFAVVISAVFYIVCYLSIKGMLGWPTQRVPPQHFELVAVHVQEPDKRSGAAGNIYLWLKPPMLQAAPRAYEFSYDATLHEASLVAAKKIGRGIRQLGEYREPDSNSVMVEDRSGFGQESRLIVFYDPPDPLYPIEK